MFKEEEAQVRRTYTVEEVRLMLGMGRNQAYEAIGRGDIPSVRIGKRWHVPKADFDRKFPREAS